MINLLPSKIFFDDFFDELSSTKEIDDTMKCDIYEENGEYIIEVLLPGFKKDDINIEYENGYLKLTAAYNDFRNENDNLENKRKYLKQERQIYKKYQRQFYIGEINEDLKAKLKDGILRISFQKLEKNSDTKKSIMIED